MVSARFRLERNSQWPFCFNSSDVLEDPLYQISVRKQGQRRCQACAQRTGCAEGDQQDHRGSHYKLHRLPLKAAPSASFRSRGDSHSSKRLGSVTASTSKCSPIFLTRSNQGEEEEGPEIHGHCEAPEAALQKVQEAVQRMQRSNAWRGILPAHVRRPQIFLTEYSSL